jgi:DNA-binding MarR family transcriptional regulator
MRWGVVDGPVVDEALLALARAVMRISLHAADQIGGVSVVQLRALTVLREAPEANLAQLADGMGVTVSTTSRMVDRLVAADLVDRRPAAHTRREIALRLTRRGRSTLDRYDELRLVGLRSCLESVPDDLRDPTVAALQAFGAGECGPPIPPAEAG